LCNISTQVCFISLSKRNIPRNDKDQGIKKKREKMKKSLPDTDDSDLARKSEKNRRIREASINEADDELIEKLNKKRKIAQSDDENLLKLQSNNKKKKRLNGGKVAIGTKMSNEEPTKNTVCLEGGMFIKKSSNESSIRESEEETDRENDQIVGKPKFRIKLKSKIRIKEVESDKKVIRKEKIRNARESKMMTKVGQFNTCSADTADIGTRGLSGDSPSDPVEKIDMKRAHISRRKKTREASEGMHSKGNDSETQQAGCETDESEYQQDRTAKTLSSDGRLARKSRIKKSHDESSSAVLVPDDASNSKMFHLAKYPSTTYNDTAFWKRRRESLQGDFSEARSNFTEFGPWHLPDSLQDEDFVAVAEKTLDRMCK
jgi:hypothetical protein